MGTTTNGLPYPESTDFVTDGAQAIEDLAVDVDAKMGLYKVIPSGATNGTVGTDGDVTIGNAVSSVTVSGAFSSDYDNYLITISGGSGSSAGLFKLTLGSTVTNYYSSLIYTNWANTPLASGTSTGTGWNFAGYHGTGLASEIFVGNPNLAKPSWMRCSWISLIDTGFVTGYLNNTTSYTAFTLTPSAGTLTGGVIRVYGYRN